MIMTDYIKRISNNEVDAIAHMTKFLNNNEGFATQVCNLLSEFYEDWACYFIEEEYDDDDEVIGYHLANKRDITDTFCRYCEDEWAWDIEGLADKDDYDYNLIYKMKDWECAYVRNYIPNIIEEYVRYKLGVL